MSELPLVESSIDKRCDVQQTSESRVDLLMSHGPNPEQAECVSSVTERLIVSIRLSIITAVAKLCQSL